MTTELEQLAKYLQALGLKAECRDHPRKKELDKMKRLLKQSNIETPYFSFLTSSLEQQVIVEGDHGEISIIAGELAMSNFEIYCIKGELFEGIRRYKTMTDCARTIYGLLTTGMFDEDIPRAWDAFTDFFTNDLGPDGSTQEVIDVPGED